MPTLVRIRLPIRNRLNEDAILDDNDNEDESDDNGDDVGDNYEDHDDDNNNDGEDDDDDDDDDHVNELLENGYEKVEGEEEENGKEKEGEKRDDDNETRNDLVRRSERMRTVKRKAREVKGIPSKTKEDRNSKKKSVQQIYYLKQGAEKSQKKTILADNSLPPVHTYHPLPIDDNFETWLDFGNNKGYGITAPLWKEVVDWVRCMRNDKVKIAEHVAFHQLIVDMKKDIGIKAARDLWVDVLPKKNQANYFWATLMLMIATPATPDKKIIQVFEQLYREHFVTEEWVLKIGREKLEEILKPLGRYKMSAEYIIKAAETVNKLRLSGLDPRDYRIITQCKGVGSKVALVTCQEAFGFAQGIPCDVHMCRIFTLLGWVPSFQGKKEGLLADRLSNKTKNENHKYEAVRAVIEGWFPYRYWSELNQTWAGLGQLLHDEESRRLIANYIDGKASQQENKTWRLADRDTFGTILDYYVALKRGGG